MGFRHIQQDAWPWGEWKSKACVLSFTGEMFLPPRPLILMDCVSLQVGFINLTTSYTAESALPDSALCLPNKQTTL